MYRPTTLHRNLFQIHIVARYSETVSLRLRQPSTPGQRCRYLSAVSATQLEQSARRSVKSINPKTQNLATNFKQKKVGEAVTSIPEWRLPLSAKQKDLVKQLEEAIRHDNITTTWMIVQILIKDRVLIRMKPDTLGDVFWHLRKHNSPVLEDFLDQIKEQNSRFPTAQHYAEWIRFYNELGRPLKAIQIYFQYLPVTLFKNGNFFVKAVLDIILDNKAMKDKSNTAITLNKNLVHTLLKDMLRFPKGTFDNEINGLLQKIATNRVLCDILLMYQSTLDAGYTFPVETQELVFNNTFVDNESDAETLLTLYMNIRAAGIIPNANAVSLMVHVILLREDSNVVSTLSLNERLECVLEIFHDSIACNNPLRPFALRLLLTKLKFAGRLADVDRIYNIAVDLNEHSLELDGGYISTLAQQGKLDEAFSLWKKMISNTFHLQPDGSYAGPQGERLFDIKMESISEDYYKIQNYMLARLNDESNDPMPTPADILKINTDNDIKLHYESTTVRTPDTASTAPDTDCNTVCVKSNSIDIYPMTTATEDLIVAYRQKKTIKNVYIIYGMLHKLKCVNHRIIPGYIRMLFERQDYQACLETMNDIIKFKIPFNILTTLNYCKVYIVLNDLKKAERILDMYMATRCYTAHLERNTDLYKAEPMYLILAYEYTMAGQLEDAKRMFSKCDINELRTKEMTAGLLIMTYIEQNSVEKLKSLLKFIDEHQIVLHDNHYTMILAFFGKSAQIDQVLYWYTRVCAIGLEKDIFIITCLIQAYSYCNRCDMAIEFYRTARRKYGYYVNNTILSVLCDVSGYHKSIADLEQIWQDGITDKVKPNENNYAAFAEAYWRIGFTEKAVNVLLKEMPRAGFAPNYIMLLTLIKVTKRNGPSQMYHRLLQAMKKWYHNKHQIMNINEWVDEESRQKEYIEDIKKYAM